MADVFLTDFKSGSRPAFQTSFRCWRACWWANPCLVTCDRPSRVHVQDCFNRGLPPRTPIASWVDWSFIHSWNLYKSWLLEQLLWGQVEKVHGQGWLQGRKAVGGDGGVCQSPSVPFWPKSCHKLLNCCCSAAQPCPTLCDPMGCSTPGFPVHYQLPELA